MGKANRQRGYALFELVVAMAVGVALLTVAGTAVLSVVNENRRACEAYELSEEFSSLNECLESWVEKVEPAVGEKTIETFADGDIVGFRVLSSETIVYMLCFDKEEKTLKDEDKILLTVKFVDYVEFVVYDGMLKIAAFYGESERAVFLSAI